MSIKLLYWGLVTIININSHLLSINLKKKPFALAAFSKT